MATERLSGKVPDFIGAAQAGWSFGRGVQRDLALQDAEMAPMADAAVAPVASAGLADAQPPVDPAAQRMARRASVYRQFGDDADADRMLQANASLGLTNAQVGETKVRTANEVTRGKSDQLGLESKKRENDAAISQKQIRESTGAELTGLTGPDGQPRPPTSDEIFANQRTLAQRLYTAGHGDAADAAVKSLKANVAAQIETDKAQRVAEGGKVLSQVMGGDFSGLAAYNKRFGYGIGGASIDDIKPGQQPGTVVMTFTDNQGQKQKVMPAAELQKLLVPELHRSLTDDAYATKKADENIDAQIDVHKAQATSARASAGSLSAAADAHRESTAGAKYDRERKQQLDKIYNKDSATRTPEEAAIIRGYSDKVDDSRAYRQPGTGKPQIKVNPDGSQTATMPDGKVYQQARSVGGKMSPWVEITPGATPTAVPAGAISPGGGAPAGVAPPARPPLSSFGGR